jgi:hypothetical protein
MPAHWIQLQHRVVPSLSFNFPPPLWTGLEMGEKKVREKWTQQVFLTTIELCLSIHVFVSIPKTLWQNIHTVARLCQKCVPNFVQAGCPNSTHTNSTNMFTPLSKVHLTHLSSPHSPPTHHTYIPPNIHTVAQLQSQALPLQKHSKQGREAGRVRGDGHTTLQALNNTQWPSYHTTTLVSSNHRTLHCP